MPDKFEISGYIVLEEDVSNAEEFIYKFMGALRENGLLFIGTTKEVNNN